jgi:hypothetical protein
VNFFRSLKKKSNLIKRIEYLEKEVQQLKECYCFTFQDIKRLEEENIENSNLYYELSNSVDAVDRRIDILFENRQ